MINDTQNNKTQSGWYNGGYDEAVVQVDTDTFVTMNNDQQPQSIGEWVFEGDYEEETSFFGMYEDAERQAVEWARDNGIRFVELIECR